MSIQFIAVPRKCTKSNTIQVNVSIFIIKICILFVIEHYVPLLLIIQTMITNMAPHSKGSVNEP